MVHHTGTPPPALAIAACSPFNRFIIQAIRSASGADGSGFLLRLREFISLGLRGRRLFIGQS